MAEYPIYTVQKACRVGVVGDTEYFFIYRTKPGDRIIACDAQKTTLAGASTNSAFQVGDSTDPDGFMTEANIDPEAGTAADFVDGTGAYLTDSGGKLYTIADDIYAIYTPHSTPGTTKPEILVRLWVAKD